MSNERFLDIYHDHGCDISPSCLECPLARCKYDEPGIAYVSSSEQVAELRQQGLSVSAIAKQLGISERSVYRRAERARRSENQESGPDPGSGSKPLDAPANLVRQPAAVALRNQAIVIYYKACRKCHGDVVFDGEDMNCIQCGFNQLSQAMRETA